MAKINGGITQYIYPTLVSLCFLLVGAHFMRGGASWVLASFFTGSALVWTRQSWMRLPVFATLLCTALLWVKTGFLLLSMRIVMEENWIRLAVIFGAIFVATLTTAMLTFRSEGKISGEHWFYKNPKKATLQSGVFILCMAALFITRSKVPFPILLADRFLPHSGSLEILLLSTYGAWLAGKMYSPAGAKKMRPLIWGGFSIVFFGQLFLGLLGKLLTIHPLEQMLMTGKLHLPVPALIVGGPLFRGEGFFMPILFMVTLILVGPAWCSSLCYIGAWDDKLSRRAKIHKAVSNSTMWKSRGGALALTVFSALLFRHLHIPAPYALTAAALFGLTGLYIMYAISKKRGVMVHCTAFCPMGILANTLGKISPWRLKIRTDIPVEKIHHAQKTCRYGAMTDNAVQSGKPLHSCTLCLDCMAACKKGDITLTACGRWPSTARIVYLIILISLHVLFLGVARI